MSNSNSKVKNTSELFREKTVFSLLQDVFLKGMYSSIALDEVLNKIKDDNAKPYITMLFYGVLSKSFQLDYIVSKLVTSSPKPAVKIILKLGLYLIRFTDTPNFAAVNKTVELVKELGKAGVAGFINAVLKKSMDLELPDINSVEGLSVHGSCPIWLTKKLVNQYSFDFSKQLLMYEKPTTTHIRHNGFKISKAEFESKYPFLIKDSSDFGYYVTHSTLEKLHKSEYVIQSLASCIITHAYFNQEDKNILDLCAAPGGKAVHLKQLHLEHSSKAVITACDIHPHRVSLITKYAAQCNCEINILQNDATIFNPNFENAFDLVVCDAPCSGLGVIGSKPDIAFFKSEDDIISLSKLQDKILSVAKRYVKKGGRLCYSTCTIAKDENEFVAEKFLNENSDFSLNRPYLRLFPHIDNCDGFFFAEFKKS